MNIVIIGFACFAFGFLLAGIMAGSGRKTMCEECRMTRDILA